MTNIPHAKRVLAHQESQMNKITAVDQAPAPSVSTPAALMQVIATAALNPEYDLDRMERIFKMYLEMDARADEKAGIARKQAQETEFYTAMAAAQAEMKAVAADKDNAQTNSKYASYYALDKMARPIYLEHGFDITYDTSPHANPDWINVLCRVGHTGGHSRTWCFPVPADGKGAKGGDVMTKTHAAKSAVTYGRHTLLTMAFNLVIGGNGDDDGNGAGVHPETDLPDSIRAYIDSARDNMNAFQTVEELQAWWKTESSVRDKLDLVNTRSKGPKPGYRTLFAAYAARGKELSAP